MNSRFGLLNELRLRYGLIFGFLLIFCGLIWLYNDRQAARLELIRGDLETAARYAGDREPLAAYGVDTDLAPGGFRWLELNTALNQARQNLKTFEKLEKVRGTFANLLFLASALGILISFSIPALARFIEEIRQASNQMASSTGEINRISDDHVSQSTNQATAVVELAWTAEEIAEASRSINQSTDEMRGIATHAKEACEHGRSQVNRAMEEMTLVREKVDDIASSATNLDRTAARIISIVEIIDEISDQTNLLALNAAIEAAGAGEAGKRFAVVATEIRRLSERTVQAINQISELIDDTRTQIQEAVKLTKIGSLAVKRSASEILSFGTKFEEIFKTVEETDAQVREILTATEQQALSTEQMETTVGSVREMVEEVLQGAKDSRRAAEDLSRLAAHLTELVRNDDAADQEAGEDTARKSA